MCYGHLYIDVLRAVICCSSNRDEEEMEEYFRRKYADAAATQDMYGDGEDMADEISQQGLLPGVK